MVAAGSMFEVVNLLVPSLFPEIQNDPLMKLHHSNAIVKWWTLCSNGLSMICGGALAASAVGAWRGRRRAARLACRAASPGEPALPGQAGVVAWVEGSRRGGGLRQVFSSGPPGIDLRFTTTPGVRM